ncbi:uncharacterized protein [Miscanthus floridulus]|uniref:uncharacterized protein n=1 Tax=Miscanthus floridulus TaxID=154761 RepID=UPI003457C5DB
MTVFNHSVYLNVTTLCPQHINLYIINLTASYTDQSNEPTIVSSSVIMFVLAGLFFNLNLFSGISDVSAILDPKVRLFLSSVLSLFLPVMSYLFSEAKNARSTTSSSSSSTSSTAGAADLSLTAGLILVWMLLVELLRKKVDEIRMRGYSSTIQRAGRVFWLGNLVFFNIKSVGRKAVFGILWILCATKVAQRIAFTEVGKRSYAHGKNASVLTSYMAQMLDVDDHGDESQQHHPAPAGDHVDVEHGEQHGGIIGNEMLRRCNYIVMGEKKLVKKATADGYEFNDVASNDSIVTVGKVWELAESDQLFDHYDKNQRLKRLCLSFALFKLLRRRFEHLPAMTDAEARDCRSLILNGLYNNNGGSEGNAAEALFQVMNDEVNFLSEYYHSVIPVVFASPFFLVANYLLLPVVVTVLCLMSIVLCGNGDAGYAFKSLGRDNYTLRSGVPKIVVCLVARAANRSAPAFFSLVDLAITVFLFIIFFYEEIWEFLVFLLSNWFMVSVLCDYTAKRHWRESPTFSGAFRRLLWLRSKMSHGDLRLKQFSVLNLRWPLPVPLFAPLSLAVRSEPAPNSLKRSIIDCLVRHDRDNTPLTNGKSVLERHHLSTQLKWACGSDSVAEVILTWHIATSILVVKCAPQSKDEVALSRVATRLSKYCAYLVAFHPELLPDNKEKAETVFEDMKAELKSMIGCPAYFLSSKSTKVQKIMERAGEIHVETPGQDKAAESGQSDDESKVVLNAAKLAGDLLREGGDRHETVWKVLADVWTELIVFVAPSNEEERVKGHEQVLVQGGEFITVLWALTTHIGVTRPTPNKRSSTSTSGRL